MRVVLPTKGDAIAIHREEAMIRDGHSMGIAGQILQHVLRPAKWSLGINDPVFPKQSAQEGCECLLVGQGLTRAKKDRLSPLKARRNPATNFPRKTRLSTLTGKEKWGAERIHRE